MNDYHRKENRNAFIVSNELSEKFSLKLWII
ncbi:hypothetical protein WBU86_11260 [Escherichia coli]